MATYIIIQPNKAETGDIILKDNFTTDGETSGKFHKVAQKD